MKSKTDRFIVLLLTIFMTLLFASPISAHPGRTDANGGHYDHSSGEYHYHHGYPAHQHIDGKCPYDFDDKTDHNSGGGKSGSNGNSVGNKSTTVTTVQSVKATRRTSNTNISFVILSVVGVYGLFYSPLLFSYIKKRRHKKEMDEKVKVSLPCGCNIDLSAKVHQEHFTNFDEGKYLAFNNIINSGLYFPQIMQFVSVMVLIFDGYTSFLNIFLCNLISGIGFTLFWFLFKVYKTPGINFICCLIGGNIFRYFLHFVIIAAVAFFVVGDWKIILFCLVGGLASALIRSFLFAKLSNVKYNDGAAIYVSKFKT